MNFKKALMTLGAVAAMAVSGSGSLFAAQSGVIDVPFSFKYLNTEMPSGRYYFRYDTSPSSVMLTNVETRSTFSVAMRAGHTQQRLRLLFENRPEGAVLKQVR
jgi:hypothetical protein